MAVMEKVRDVLSKDKEPDDKVLDRLRRGRARMVEGAAGRNECMAFVRGDQYCFVNDRATLVRQSTQTSVVPNQGKPDHRIRRTRNLLIDVVAHEQSAANQRVPSYEVSPSTIDPDDVSAARLAEKVALYGYGAWKVRQAVGKAIFYAIVTGEGFIWPYFNNQIGTPLAEDMASGDICLRVFGPNEVYWEPGCDYEESPWHAVEQARPLSQVYQMPGYSGGLLAPDASSSDVMGEKRKASNSQMVLVTEYLERPTMRNPQGQRVIMANGKEIAPQEPYPCATGSGEIVDEPALLKLSYFIDPDADRDMGLVQHLLDSMRTYNNAGNKAHEWMNLALMPQLLAPIGSMETRRTDEPGAINYYRPIGGLKPEWAPTPPIPQELFQIQDRALADIGRIAAQNDIPQQVESGKGIVALHERDAQRRQDFISNLAEFHSDVMRHCLYLVQKHYTEARLVKIKGSFGWETIPSFRGADLRGQADIRVFPGSIEPRTRAAIEAKVLAFADRGWIPPQAAMAAINGGVAEDLLDDYERDVQRANTIIQKIKMGPEALFAEPKVPGPFGQEIEPWMPREFDNIPVHKSVFESWLKTQEYDAADSGMKEAANVYYSALLELEAQKAAREAAQQTMMAEQLGMGNAAKPQGAKPMPDQPSLQNEPAGQKPQ